MTLRSNVFAALLVILTGLCFGAELKLGTKALTQAADRIVRAKITGLVSRPGTNQFGDELICTDVTVRVEETLMGEGADFVLTVEGGTINGTTLKVSTAPDFSRGDHVLIFAKQQGATIVPAAGSQSRFTIRKDGFLPERGLSYRMFRKEILEVLNREKQGK